MYFSAMYCVDIASRSLTRGHQTTLKWKKQIFIHTRLSHTYLALARLSCCVVLGIIEVIGWEGFAPIKRLVRCDGCHSDSVKQCAVCWTADVSWCLLCWWDWYWWVFLTEAYTDT